MDPETLADTSPVLQKSKLRRFFDTVRFIVITVALVFGFRYFIAQPFVVSGESMIPTFKNGDYLIVDELSYRLGDPRRGDVIIMRYPLEPKKYFIKRIVGLPGETVSIQGTQVSVTTTEGNLIELDEPYVKNTRSDFLTVTLKINEYFVLGDNRAASLDSRRWGPLPANDIIGKPVVRLFPISSFDFVPGSVEYK